MDSPAPLEPPPKKKEIRKNHCSPYLSTDDNLEKIFIKSI